MANTTTVAKPKKLSSSTIIMYIIFSLLIIGAAAYIGTRLDSCQRSDGTIDISLFSNSVFTMKKMFNSLSNNGYALKLSYLSAFGIAIFFLYKLNLEGNRFHRRGVEHGSARWGTDEEKRKLMSTEEAKFIPFFENGRYVKEIDKKTGEEVLSGYYQDNNIIFAEDVKLNLDTHKHRLNLNTVVIGGSGAGKTRFFALPNIMQLNTSYVVTDPKGEILGMTGKMLLKAGYKVRVFNTINMSNSNNYNPFEYVYDHNGRFVEDNVLKLVTVLFTATKTEGEKEDFWSQKGKTLLEAVIFLLFEESAYNAEKDEKGNIIESTRDKTRLNFFSVTEKMRKLRYPPKGSQVPDGFFLTPNEGENPMSFEERRNKAFLSELDKDFIELEKRNPDALALRLYKEVRNAPEETGQSFLSSANVKTFIYNLDNVKNLTCCDTIHLETIGEEKTALFLIMSATDSTYDFMSAMLYTQMFDVLSNRANFKYKGVLPIHVRCIMDEFANLGEIPNFKKVVSYVRSMGMSLNVIVQNLTQLKANYEKTWEIITGNCDTQIFLGGKEETTTKSISESLGKETIDIKAHNRTKGRQSSTSENNSIVGRELLQINEVSTLPIDECIVTIRSQNPFHSKKYPLEKHPNYKWLEFEAERMFDVDKIHTITVSEIMNNQSYKKVVEIKKEVVAMASVKSNELIDTISEVLGNTDIEFKSEKDTNTKHYDDTFAIFDSPISIAIPEQRKVIEEVRSGEVNEDTLSPEMNEFDISDAFDEASEDKTYYSDEEINNQSIDESEMENSEAIFNVRNSMDDKMVAEATDSIFQNYDFFNERGF